MTRILAIGRPNRRRERVNERNRLISSVENGYNDAVLHHRDIVEEIATQRQGEIDAIDEYANEL